VEDECNHPRPRRICCFCEEILCDDCAIRVDGLPDGTIYSVCELCAHFMEPMTDREAMLFGMFVEGLPSLLDELNLYKREADDE